MSKRSTNIYLSKRGKFYDSGFGQIHSAGDAVFQKNQDFSDQALENRKNKGNRAFFSEKYFYFFREKGLRGRAPSRIVPFEMFRFRNADVGSVFQFQTPLGWRPQMLGALIHSNY